MKVMVTRSCGHTEQVEVFGKNSDRERKLKWYEETCCKDCYRDHIHADDKEVEMPYREYKLNYSDCKTKPGSYNPRTKTVVVYVPEGYVEEYLAH